MPAYFPRKSKLSPFAVALVPEGVFWEIVLLWLFFEKRSDIVLPMSKIRFVKSATQLSQMPEDDVPEVAFAGRSNSGKSSLINCLAGSRIAKVSGTPGKTRLLNLFDHKLGYRLVDMPGYGFAARSGAEVKSWQKMIESTLMDRENLSAVLLVMDIRRSWSQDEQMLLDLARNQDNEFLLVLTKADKLSRGAGMSARKKWSQSLGLDHVFMVSNLKRTGYDLVDEKLKELLVPEAL